MMKICRAQARREQTKGKRGPAGIGCGRKMNAMLQSTLCYIERGEEWLLLHRVKKENDANRDKWLGVGGHFEEGESPEDCMRREIFEETGLTVTKFRYRGIVTFVSDVWEGEYMHLFTCSDWTGEIGDCNEGDLEWIDKRRLYDLTMWQGDRIFLELLDTERPFFSLKLTYRGEELVSAVLDGEPLPI